MKRFIFGTPKLYGLTYIFKGTMGSNICGVTKIFVS